MSGSAVAEALSRYNVHTPTSLSICCSSLQNTGIRATVYALLFTLGNTPQKISRVLSHTSSPVLSAYRLKKIWSF